jgi:hypothetical protein
LKGRFVAAALGLPLLLSIAGGCSDDGPDLGMMSPVPVNVVGEWSVTQTEVFDPCGLFAGGLITPWVVEDSGADVNITIETLGACRSNTYTRSGDIVVRQSAGLFLDPQGQACQASLMQTETFTFTSTDVSGTINSRFEFASGVCNRPYPCDVVITVSGARCTDCSSCN